MVRILLKTLLFAALVFVAPVTPAAAQEHIAAVVNDDIVSASDFQARLRLVMVSSGLPNNKEIRDKLTPQIINGLIEESLKIQEAEKIEAEVTAEEIKEGFAVLAAQNKFSVEQFKQILQNEKVPVSTIEDQIRAQISWSKVIQQKLHAQVEILDREVDAVMERMGADIGKHEYLVSEIFLAVNSPQEDQDAKKLADKLVSQLMEGKSPFQNLATQFSQSPGASRGGDMGWVQEGQLPEELDKLLSVMKTGDLSKAVRSLSGYHILYLRDKRKLEQANIPTREEIRNQLGLQRLERLQRRYLLDLKTEAFIERRV